MKLVRQIALIGAVVVSTGCASGLNSFQKQEYQAMEADGVLVKEKNTTTGALLGILPGGGSFYAGEAGLGVLNLLMWPVSILWDPISGYNGAESDNYFVSMQKLKKDKSEEISKLDDKLALKLITTEQYMVEKNQLEERYSY
jgi:hypothetical protein